MLKFIYEKEIVYHGADVSQKLVDLAKSKYPQFRHNFLKISGQTNLDFPDNFFDVVVSIAVFHHFPDKKFRQEMAKEFGRITKPGGIVVVSVWNLWQKKFHKYIWKNIFRKLIGKSQLDWLDGEIPFRNNLGESFARFHHAYTLKEMKTIFSLAGYETLEARVVNSRNLVLIGRKI